MEIQIHETQTALAQFLLENNSLKVQLDEEKQKNEDLLFRFEEGSINMDDIQVRTFLFRSEFPSPSQR